MSLLLPEGSLVQGQSLPSDAPVEVLSGGFRLEGEALRSSLLRFAPGEVAPSGWVDKHRLVPLGEWIPFGRWWRWAGLSAVGGVEPGPPSRLLLRPAGPIGVAICYELSDGRALRSAVLDGARWLLASANLDPYPVLLKQQFSALSQLRAIETGRWLVSVANTGPSLVIDQGGVIQRSLPLEKATTALVSVDSRRSLTPYDHWGETPLLGLMGLGLIGRCPPRRRPEQNHPE